MLPATNTPPPPVLAEHPRKALRNTCRVEDETSNAAVATTAMAPPEPPVPNTDDDANDDAYLGGEIPRGPMKSRGGGGDKTSVEDGEPAEHERSIRNGEKVEGKATETLLPPRTRPVQSPPQTRSHPHRLRSNIRRKRHALARRWSSGSIERRHQQLLLQRPRRCLTWRRRRRWKTKSPGHGPLEAVGGEGGGRTSKQQNYSSAQQTRSTPTEDLHCRPTVTGRMGESQAVVVEP
jgi:hypothetical protein